MASIFADNKWGQPEFYVDSGIIDNLFEFEGESSERIRKTFGGKEPGDIKEG